MNFSSVMACTLALKVDCRSTDTWEILKKLSLLYNNSTVFLGESLAIANFSSPHTVLCNSGKHFRPYEVSTKLRTKLGNVKSLGGCPAQINSILQPFLLLLSLRFKGIQQLAPLLSSQLPLALFICTKGRSYIFTEWLITYSSTPLLQTASCTSQLHKKTILAFLQNGQLSFHFNLCRTATELAFLLTHSHLCRTATHTHISVEHWIHTHLLVQRSSNNHIAQWRPGGTLWYRWRRADTSQ